MEPLLVVALVMIVAKMGAELWLEAINRAHVRAHADHIPEALRNAVDAPTYARSGEYTLARSRFSTLSSVWQALWLCAMIATPLLSMVFGKFHGWLGDGAGAPLAVMLTLALLGLPDFLWDWWDHFVIEAKFGFNKSTPQLWVIDKVKETVVSLVIAYPLLWLIFWVIGRLGELWWIWAWGITVAFVVVLTFVGPVLIMPIFNKFTPLPEGDLRTRLMALAKKTAFRAASIQIMDGSKRSGHSNAFFAGFGSMRKIVLFDTLIEQLEPVELEAVLAHEIGHNKLGHNPQRLIVLAVMAFVGFAVIGWLLSSPSFAGAFGFEAIAGQIGPVFLLFMLLAGVVTFWITPLHSISSRRHEYQADAFARNTMGTSEPLIQALRKLHIKNLGNLVPHPWYSRFYYSHPTILEREAALRK
ncbi:MAG: M48 family metallopeptidase [Verrucomicrobiota bacterium]|nr:M48 family metallopeptidase [Verrucomicrobiota bacterium]